MTKLEEFYALKDENLKKLDSLIKQGVSKEDALKLCNNEIEKVVDFIRENQEQLQKDLQGELQSNAQKVCNQPLLALLLTLLFNSPWGGNPINPQKQ